MVKLHLKRLASPKTWPIKKKGLKKFVTRPMPSGHTFDESVALVVVLRDILQKATTSKEVKFILNSTDVLVNGKRVKEEKLAVGFMDVLTIKSLNENFRITYDNKGRISAVPISEKEAGLRLVKVDGKTALKGNKSMICCTGATNISVDEKEASKIKTKNTLLIELKEVEKTVKKNGKDVKVKVPKWAIKEVFDLKEGVLIYIINGKHKGKVATIKEMKEKTIVFVSEEKEFETKTDYAFVIGHKKPVITVVNDKE